MDHKFDKEKFEARKQAKSRLQEKPAGIGEPLWNWLKDFAKANGLDIKP